MPIALLSEEVINQIAAGEVIERPASVVKELVENALDAGARRVHLMVERGGLGLIRVSDDGEGIPPAETELAFARHATSKLRRLEELQELRTLGFRGEALPSIAAVARVTLTSRPASEPFGRQVRISGGVTEAAGECGAPPGTTVEVRDLFFNTPARRKFLKSEAAEAARIAALVTGLAVTRPEVAFTLVSDGRLVLQTPGQGDLRETFRALLGPAADGLLPVAQERAGFSVSGLISPVEMTRANRAWELFAVNGRLVESRLLQVALEKAYGGLLPLRRYPVAYLRLDLDPSEVDVNVHPAKREVRFRRESELFAAVCEAVKAALTTAEQPLYRPVAPPAAHVFAEDSGLSAPPAPVAAKRRPETLAELAFAPTRPSLLAVPPSEETTSLATGESWRYLGQLAASYLLGETPEGLVLVDQHAAHERVIYETLQHSLASGAPLPVQHLLLPVQLDLTPAEKESLSELLPVLQKLGFVLEPFGGRTILVRAVPVLAAGADPRQLLRDVCAVEDFPGAGRGDGRSLLREALLPRLACRAAVKARHPLAPSEASALFAQWQACREPWTCPHGRPVALRWSLAEIAASFLRR